MAMDAELKAKWVEALRSGKYQQGKGRMCNPHTNKFCCLGVLAHLQGAEFGPDAAQVYLNGRDINTPHRFMPESLNGGLTGSQEDYLAIHMNDNGKSFSEIADYIEREL